MNALSGKNLFVSIKHIEQYVDTEEYLPDAIYVIDHEDAELWLELNEDDRICSGRTVISDGEVLSLIKRGFEYVLSTNSNIHILKDKIITPTVTHDEAISKVHHGVKNVLWFGDLDGAIQLKKMGVKVIAYVNDYDKLDDWDFVDGFWFSFNKDFTDYLKDL